MPLYRYLRSAQRALAFSVFFISAPLSAESTIPNWSEGAIWYQIFPTRFANGDPNNDPSSESLEQHDKHRNLASWQITPWTDDWYARRPWEKKSSHQFYDTVFSRRYGGDLQGIIDRLDHLENLGVTALYLNPVFHADSLHKYDGNSFHHIDPHFGPAPQEDLKAMAQETHDPKSWTWTQADRLFLQLVQEVHRRNMKIIIDGVWNHSGTNFWAFQHLKTFQEQSPYGDWYVVHNYDSPSSTFSYEGWWGHASLPIFRDTDDGQDLNSGIKNYIFNATKRWMDPNGDGDPSDGIDGWRLDVADEVPLGFWKQWNAHVRNINPQAYTLAENWHDAKGFVQQGAFSSVMNYHGFAQPVKAFFADAQLSGSAFCDIMIKRLGDQQLKAAQRAHFNLLSSHDTPRFISTIANRHHIRLPYYHPQSFDYDTPQQVSPRGMPLYRTERPQQVDFQIMKLTVLFQMMWPGAPMVYYGEEAGMWGADDPDNRKPMLWPDLKYQREQHHPFQHQLRYSTDEQKNVSPDQAHQLGLNKVEFNHKLFRYYQKLIAFKKAHLSGSKSSSIDILWADDRSPAFAIRHDSKDHIVCALFNRRDRELTWNLPPELKKLGRPQQTLSTSLDATTREAMETSTVSVKLQPHSATAWVWKRQP